ncbi:MAG: hypothetical protein KJN89_02320 [Gammaproteobacteria bacterium]|nr:hypothetical protein [Gammaproteobacteria bacterium]MBT8135249.1 hypothetical protein [Gammaproteobacteria bacterium]NNJ49182.1 hypothetical protein [Gammaproteobacteria bacterium]
MSERVFLFIVGVYILMALYLGMDVMIYLLSLWLLFEAVTDIRLTTLSQRLLKKSVPAGLIIFNSRQRFDFDALRIWRISVAVLLGGSLILLKEQNFEFMWFFPWFMGFAIMGAGASSVCPVLLFIRWIGFK